MLLGNLEVPLAASGTSSPKVNFKDKRKGKDVDKVPVKALGSIWRGIRADVFTEAARVMGPGNEEKSICDSSSSEMADHGQAAIIIETAVCLLMNAISLVGNLLVCLAVYKNPRLRTTTNLYIVGLAATDLLSATFVMPFTVGVLATRKWPYGKVYCDIHGFLANFGLFVSTSIMGLTAFNRYVRIVKTNNYNCIFTPQKSRTMLASVCVFIACYIAVPRFARLQDFGFVPEYASCHIIHLTEEGRIAHYCIVVFLFLILPFGVAIFCYVKVFNAIRQHNLEVAPALQSRIRMARITAQEIKISKSLFVVVLAFGMCWIPAWILAIIKRFCLIPSLPDEAYLVHTALVFLSSSTNVFIYAGMNNSFKSEFRRILSCYICMNPPKVSPHLPQNGFMELRLQHHEK